MKKLGKKLYLESETIEAYACSCSCTCGSCSCTAYEPFYSYSDISADKYYGNRYDSSNFFSGGGAIE